MNLQGELDENGFKMSKCFPSNLVSLDKCLIMCREKCSSKNETVCCSDLKATVVDAMVVADNILLAFELML